MHWVGLMCRSDRSFILIQLLPSRLESLEGPDNWIEPLMIPQPGEIETNRSTGEVGAVLRGLDEPIERKVDGGARSTR